jgi:hypothetical protein
MPNINSVFPNPRSGLASYDPFELTEQSPWETNSHSADQNVFSFVEPERILPCSQEAVTGQNTEPSESCLRPFTLFI